MSAATTEVKEGTSSAQEHIRVAWSHQAKREFAHAEETFRKALEHDAGSVDGNYGLGMTLKMLDRKDEAIAAFEKVINLLKEREAADPARTEMLSRLALAHIKVLKSGAAPE